MLLSLKVSLQSKLFYSLSITFAYFPADAAFFIEDSRMMKPLCQSLDILQSEEKAYYGILLPTLLVCAKNLTDIQEVDDLAVCKPLLSAILDGLKQRFQAFVESTDCLLSAAFHPYFKLSWIPLLSLLGYEDVASARIKMQQKMALIVNNKVEIDTHSTSCQSESSDDEFFGGALAEKLRQGNSSENR